MSQPVSRRSWLGQIGTTALAVCAPTSLAIEPFQRKGSRFTGLGLSAYSLRPKMRWWMGKPAPGKGSLDLMGFLDYCADLGLEAAELTSYFFESPVESAFLGKLKRRAHLLGVNISGGAMGNDFSHPPGSDEAGRQLDYFRAWLDHFADLGAPAVRIFASRNPPRGVAPEQLLKNVIANLEPALAHAEKRGVLLGLENHDLVRNIDYLLQILKAIRSDWLGVTWDSANLAPTPDPYAELARIAPYAITAQIKVMTKVNGKDVPADYQKLVEILRKANYRGYLVAEYEEPQDPYEAIPPFLKALRAAINR